MLVCDRRWKSLVKRFYLEHFFTNVSVLTNSIIISDNVHRLHLVRTNAIKSK